MSINNVDAVLSGPLYIEASGIWEEMFCEILPSSVFQAKEKLHASRPASKSNSGEVIVSFNVPIGQVDAKALSMSLPALSSIMHISKLRSTPYFFQVTTSIDNVTCNLAAFSDSDRNIWLEAFNDLALLLSKANKLVYQKKNEANRKTFVHTNLVEGLIVDKMTDRNRFAKVSDSPDSPKKAGVNADQGVGIQKKKIVIMKRSQIEAMKMNSQITGGDNEAIEDASISYGRANEARSKSQSRTALNNSKDFSRSASADQMKRFRHSNRDGDRNISNSGNDNNNNNYYNNDGNNDDRSVYRNEVRGSRDNGRRNKGDLNDNNEGYDSRETNRETNRETSNDFSRFWAAVKDNIDAVISPNTPSKSVVKGNQSSNNDNDIDNDNNSSNNPRSRNDKRRDKAYDDVSKADKYINGDEDVDENDVNKKNSLKKKLETVSRFVKVTTMFPFVIVSTSLSGSKAGQFMFLKSIFVVRCLNLMIYVLPILLVHFILARFQILWVHKLTIGLYLFLYLGPVAFVSFTKMKNSSSSTSIEEGTFCFKPSGIVRYTQSNFWAFFTIFFEWFQHVVYVLPTTVTGRGDITLISEQYGGYVSFEGWFWVTVVCCFACGLILILNCALLGKAHHKFQTNPWVWFFLYNVGTPMYITFITILFMGLLCDYSVDPPVLVQDPTMVCYGDRHLPIARASLMSLALYLVQNTLLPTGTFKETMGDGEADVMFVPVYLQIHFLLKALFCGVYVFFYTDDWIRCITLTIINVLILIVNNYMKPCSVDWINIMRDTFFIHSSISGIQSINYLAWPESQSTRDMVISTLASNVFFVTITMALYVKFTRKSVDYSIAKTFLDLEWQVAQGESSVHPRVLEPMICLTLSPNESDWEIAKKYMDQLVWLISYPNQRVQFQTTWSLANLALCDESCRMLIHKNNGTTEIFQRFEKMPFVVQLESLACLANLTQSIEIVEDMVNKHDCIRFFIDIAGSSKMKHSQFALIALANVAKSEQYRCIIRSYGGIQVVVGGLMSADYYKRRYACLALANIALSNSKDILQAFESKAVIDRVLKMAKRNEIETQKEVMALIRNLACHSRLRPILLQRGVMDAVHRTKDSVFPEVAEWCGLIMEVMQREIQVTKFSIHGGPVGVGNIKKNTPDSELLERMTPLNGVVEWSTWGSKLENMFSIIFADIPTLKSSNVITYVGQSIYIDLCNGMSTSSKKEIMDKASYQILHKPLHGTLDEPANNAIKYSPFKGFVGVDVFTFRMNISGASSWPTTVSITVSEDPRFYNSASGNGLAVFANEDDDEANEADGEANNGADDRRK